MNPEYGQVPEVKEFELKELALLYAKVFGAPPWNEVWRCSSCNRFYGPEYSQGKPSPCCSTLLTAAYPEKETINYIKEELSQPYSQIRLLRLPENRLIAFAWGYQIENATILAQKKWPQSNKIQREVIKAIAAYNNPNLSLYYLSEVGVSPSFRRKGLGLYLTEDIVDYGLSLRLPVVFRTNWASPMMRIARKLEMQQIMGTKITATKNQIVQTGEIARFIDEINPDRTLFIKTP